MRKLWQSWEENQPLVHGQGEGGQLCWLRHLNSLPTAVAVGVGSSFCRLVVAQVFSSAAAAVLHFRGGSVSECLPAVLLCSGAMLGREQHPSFLIGSRLAGKPSGAGQIARVWCFSLICVALWQSVKSPGHV